MVGTAAEVGRLGEASWTVQKNLHCRGVSGQRSPHELVTERGVSYTAAKYGYVTESELTRIGVDTV